MRSGGSLARSVDWLVGSGPGAGMSLLIVFCGLMISLVALVGCFIPAIRRVEDLLPDHNQPTLPLEVLSPVFQAPDKTESPAHPG